MSHHKAYNPLQVSKELYAYVLEKSLREHPNALKLRHFTESHPRAAMQGDPVQVQFMSQVIRQIGGKRGIEVGVYLGYTTLNFALAIPEGGSVLALDISEEYINLARPFWQQAGVESKIDVRIGPAFDTLQHLIDNGEEETFDFAFIDADKLNYPLYYQQLVKLIRKGGVIFVDNVLWSGTVINPAHQDEDTRGIRTINDMIQKDERVYASLLTIGDGVFFVTKK